jgi:hypothetical protein
VRAVGREQLDVVLEGDREDKLLHLNGERFVIGKTRIKWAAVSFTKRDSA